MKTRSSRPAEREPRWQSRRGLGIPIAVMAGAVLVILAVTIATVAADRRLPVIVAEGAQSFSSATWSALSLFRREAEERLRAKDAEIRSINAQLAELERRRDMLQQAMEATLLDLATELRTQTAGELELERVRLEGAGMPPEEIERRLAGFSEVLSARNRQALDGERMHEQSDLDAGLLAIKAQIDAARQKLDRAYAERRQLAEEVQRQGQELLSQLRAAQGVIQLRSKDVERTAKQLRDTAEADAAAAALVAGMFDSVLHAIDTGDWVGGIRAAETLRAKLDDPAIARSTIQGKRRAADVSIVSFLSSYLERQRELETVMQPGILDEILGFLPALRRAGRASSLYARGSAAEAEAAYTAALRGLPGFERLVTAHAEAEARSVKTALSAALERAAAVSLDGGDPAAGSAELERGVDAFPDAYRQEARRILEAMRDLYRNNSPVAVASAPASPAPVVASEALIAAGAYSQAVPSPGGGIAGVAVDIGSIRSQAYREALDAVSYLAGSTGDSDEAVRRTLLDRAAADATYQEFIQSLQDLSESGSKGRRILLQRYEFVGFVTGIGAGRLTVDPLTSRTIPVGTRVAIRRRNAEGQVSEIAAGVVASASASRLQITFDEPATEAGAPDELDIVYALLSE